MTTIAYDGRYLAADGLKTRGDNIVSHVSKKIFKKDTALNSYLIAGTGRTDDTIAFVNWMGTGDDYPDHLDDDSFEAIMFSRSVKAVSERCNGYNYYGNSNAAMDISTPYAIGTKVKVEQEFPSQLPVYSVTVLIPLDDL